MTGRPADPVDYPDGVAAMSRADQVAMRDRRWRAVQDAYPEMTPAHVYKAISDFYRGKPGNGHIRRAIAKAGLL